MTKRNTDLLSNRDMFVKYANVVEVARNAKIEIKHYGGTNCVSYHGIFDNKHKFKILSATPNVKGIEKFVGIIHELSHVLFQSPFNATKKLLHDHWGLEGERYELFFNIFNVLEDQRIESQMGKMYLKHKMRFDKTTKKLGTLMNIDRIMKDNPCNALLIIRFQRGNDISDIDNYDVYDKALKDVVLTDKYGALRVLVTLKPYIDKWLDDKENKINNPAVPENRSEELKRLNDKMLTRSAYNKNKIDDIGDDQSIPDDIKDAEDWDGEMVKESQDKGKRIVSDIFESLRDDGQNIKLPKNVKIIKRSPSVVETDHKISNGLSKIFRTIMMRNRDFIDHDGEEIDVESYVERIISGNDIGKCRINQKISHGVSIVLSIDASHSMEGNRINTARKLVSTIFESVKSIDNGDVRANVWSGDINGKVGMTEINSEDEIKFITTHNSYFSTPVHMALEYSGTMLKRMKGSKKMMIIITDGHPNNYNAGYHMTWHQYSVSCKKSLVKAKAVTPNIMCIVVQDHDQYGYNPIKTLFKGSKIMNVVDMDSASEKVIKQFKIMVMRNLVR